LISGMRKRAGTIVAVIAGIVALGMIIQCFLRVLTPTPRLRGLLLPR